MSNQFPEKDLETIDNKFNEGPQFENISTFEILNVNELRDLTRGESKPILISKQKVTFVKTPNKVARYTRKTLENKILLLFYVSLISITYLDVFYGSLWFFMC